jgi:hypothetical protein
MWVPAASRSATATDTHLRANFVHDLCKAKYLTIHLKAIVHTS